MARSRRDLRDAGAHGAGADHGDGNRRSRAPPSAPSKRRRALGHERAPRPRGSPRCGPPRAAGRARGRAARRGALVADASSARLIRPRPLVGWVARWRASAVASAIRRSSSTTRQIRPQASACSAASGSPSSARPRARAAADQARQDVGAAGIRDQAELAERLDELRRAGGEHEVAVEREIGAGAGRDAVDRADHRALEAADPADQRIVQPLQGIAEIGRRVAFADHPIAEVLAGAEAAAGAGQQDGADRRVGLDAIERARQLADAWPR